ncbi:tyrosine-protein phosphatase [Aromatoleum toluclasticum]|uniref:tyrosine-protein phosphatase n=1 Tax=Aromatoleum toluclasticum TaxID=92003 RepID=UPI001D18B610|nr:tyrosine-protein phosphatase [Aromatoleum toluclasticum]MCC4117277.1 tyrosine-protein phosphatase [Aromatoleum toluclasticum]
MNRQLSGTLNFRSLAGLPTKDGRRIAGHVVLRSDQLDRLQPADWEVLASLGVKTVCDLRTASERNRFPNSLPKQGMRQIPIELVGDVRSNPELVEPLRTRHGVEGAVEMMRQLYRQFPEALAPHLSTLFRLFREDEVPVLVHCVVGKDRTGFTVAVILHALGVADEAVMADYLLSARIREMADEERRAATARIINRITERDATEAMIDAILDARPEYLSAALDAVNERYGSMQGYLRARAGLDEQALAELRERWLESR